MACLRLCPVFIGDFFGETLLWEHISQTNHIALTTCPKNSSVWGSSLKEAPCIMLLCWGQGHPGHQKHPAPELVLSLGCLCILRRNHQVAGPKPWYCSLTWNSLEALHWRLCSCDGGPSAPISTEVFLYHSHQNYYLITILSELYQVIVRQVVPGTAETNLCQIWPSQNYLRVQHSLKHGNISLHFLTYD